MGAPCKDLTGVLGIIGMGSGFAVANLDGCQTTYKPSEKWGGGQTEY